MNWSTLYHSFDITSILPYYSRKWQSFGISCAPSFSRFQIFKWFCDIINTYERQRNDYEKITTHHYDCLATPALAQDQTDSFNVAAKHAIAIETTTGKVLYEKDATTPDGVASMTKILTAYMVYKAVDQGKITWDTEVGISDYPFNLTVDSEVSNVPLDSRKYTVKQLLDATLISSANSAAIALAEKISGTESTFVDTMTAQLKEWGITDAKLFNASGLNNKYLGDNRYPGSKPDDENTMSALDIAIIADKPRLISRVTTN